MYTNLPVIFAAGYFQSKSKFTDSARYPEGSVTKLRNVISYELELFTQDSGILYLNGNSYFRKKGALLIAQPMDKRKSTLHFDAIFLHFGTTDPAIQELLHFIGGFHPDMDYEKLEPALTDICDTVLSFEPDSDILAAAKLISFLCDIKKHCLMNPVSGNNDSVESIVSNAVEYMKQHYMEPLNIGQIADHCNLSCSYFHKLFRETTHITPNSYLLKLKLSHAKSLLATTTEPISEIAIKCGFNSQAYFSDTFRREFSTSPRKFRNSFVYPAIISNDE